MGHIGMKQDQKYLFQGDSITNGGRGEDGDPNHILGHGYVFTIASRLMAQYPQEKPHFYNRGVSGNGSAQVLARWQEDALDIDPDVLSLMVGVNDCAHAGVPTDVAAYEKNVRKMLTLSRKQNPKLEIVLGLPFYYKLDGNDIDERFHSAGDRKQQDFTRKIRALTQKNADERVHDIEELRDAVRRVAGDFSARLVDCDGVLKQAFRNAPTGYWCWDGIHLTAAGHFLIAEEWLKQLPM